MSYHVLLAGVHRVCALTQISEDWSDKCPALEFLQEHGAKGSYAASCRGLAVVFQRYADLGRQGVTAEMFHEVDRANGIWQFIKGDLRVLCFIVSNDVFLTNGYIKKSQKADPSEVTRAVNAKKKYLTK
jgi:hypothetical protein